MKQKTHKKGLHPRNRHQDNYDFKKLIAICPDLAQFVAGNKYTAATIDFTDAAAVKMLNKALLLAYYDVAIWDIPANYLCPPVPGRADYIHYAADLLGEDHGGVIPRGKSIKVLDIGVGANCIYPLIGHKEYGWHFVGTDVDPLAVKVARQMLVANKGLSGAIEIRFQSNPSKIFSGILKPLETFDLVICNPPFHSSIEKAQEGTQRKWKNLGKEKQDAAHLNFGGQPAELCFPGGEEAFICKMIEESALIPKIARWFSSLVSKSSTLPVVYHALSQIGVTDIRTIEMGQGQKVSRIVAWRK